MPVQIVSETPESMRAARADARALCCRHGFDDERCDAAVLVLSELLGNAVRHGVPPVSYELGIRGNDLLVMVADGHGAAPVTPEGVSPSAESGRGLLIVQQLARRWGAEVTERGKQVWALV